jgi:hypothetical protein
MAEKNATGINENLDHPNTQSHGGASESSDQQNVKTEVKNAHASGLGSLGRSEENNLPRQDGSPEKKVQDY